MNRFLKFTELILGVVIAIYLISFIGQWAYEFLLPNKNFGDRYVNIILAHLLNFGVGASLLCTMFYIFLLFKSIWNYII